MTYKTTKAIRDLQDDEFCYYAGAIYPRPGLVVSQERLDELEEKGHIIKTEELTVDKIKAALDGHGIKYSSRAKKAELLELLKGA